MEPLFKRMSADDLDQVAAIENDLFRDPWPRRAFASDLDAANAYPIVMRLNGKVIGYASLYLAADELQIGNLAVDSQYQQRGYGSLLMRRIIELAHSHGIRQIYLEVRDSNEAARRLYLKFGFRVLGRRRLYYHNPTEDAIVMVKEID